jgi:hypothetical protein
MYDSTRQVRLPAQTKTPTSQQGTQFAIFRHNATPSREYDLLDYVSDTQRKNNMARAPRLIEPSRFGRVRVHNLQFYLPTLWVARTDVGTVSIATHLGAHFPNLKRIRKRGRHAPVFQRLKPPRLYVLGHQPNHRVMYVRENLVQSSR